MKKSIITAAFAASALSACYVVPIDPLHPPAPGQIVAAASSGGGAVPVTAPQPVPTMLRARLYPLNETAGKMGALTATVSESKTLPPDRGEQDMIHSGDTLENPVTGERLVFHRTSPDTNGEAVLVETIVRPGGYVAAAHLHPYQSERFQVLAGTLALRVGGEERVLVPGDVAVVAPGTPHRFWNAGETDARFTVEVRPALGFESLIETMFTLAAQGKTNGKGIPNPLRLEEVTG